MKDNQKSRITVVETVCQQQPGSQPVTASSRFNRLLESDEQPFVRRYTVDEEWRPLEVGWIKRASMLVILNEEGANLQVQPTEEEKRDIACRIVLVAQSVVDSSIPDSKRLAGPPMWMIRPGESLRGQPIDVRFLCLRCTRGRARVTVTIFPE